MKRNRRATSCIGSLRSWAFSARLWRRRWYRLKRVIGSRRIDGMAEKLARCYRSGDLTAVWVSDEGSEALRDLVRAREAAKQDQMRARHRLSKFLLCSGQRPRIMIMRFRPANIRLINRRSNLPRLLLALSSGKSKGNYKNNPTIALS